MSAGAALGTVVPMGLQEGESGRELASVRTALTARDADLADADRVLAEVLAAVHTAAVESIARIEAVRADIDGAVAGRTPDSAASAHELSRLLVAKQREIASAVHDAKEVADANTVVLQSLMQRYRRHSAG